MTYYIDTRPHNNNPEHTVLTRAYGLSSSIILGTISNEQLIIVRSWEDNSNPVWVESYANFTYL